MQRFRFSLGLRIYSIIGLSFCSLIGLAAMQANNLADSLKQQRQSELSHLAQLAKDIAREEYDAALRDHSPDELARKTAAARIGKLRYGNDDYFWINDLGARMIMHPVKPEMEGQNYADLKDSTGKRFFAEFLDLVKSKGSGYVYYQWPKPGSDAPQPKLSYVTGFEPWGWVIGTGVYIDDIQAQLWESAKKVIFAALIVIGLLGTVTLIMARRMSSALVVMTSPSPGSAKATSASNCQGSIAVTSSATWPVRSNNSRLRPGRRPVTKPKPGSRRTIWPPGSANGRCISSLTNSKARSAKSSGPCRRPRPSLRVPPAR